MVPKFEGPLSFQVASFIYNRLAVTSPDLRGALMVNHGEQVNIGKKGHAFEPVLAVMPTQTNGSQVRILATWAEHAAFTATHEAALKGGWEALRPTTRQPWRRAAGVCIQ